MPMFLTEGATVISSSDFTAVLDALKTQISTSTIVEVLVTSVGATVGLAFMWWGVRKLVRALMGAFKKGKVTV